MKKPKNIEHEKLWNLAVENCQEQGKKNKKAYTDEYNRLMKIRTKPRTIFDKKLLCFKKNEGTKENPKWDTSVTTDKIKKNTPERDVLFRTVKHLTSGKCKTYADVLAFRVDWLMIGPAGEYYGTPKAIRASIENCKQSLEFLDAELESLGFDKYGFTSALEEENRTGTHFKDLKERLKALGIIKKE